MLDLHLHGSYFQVSLPVLVLILLVGAVSLWKVGQFLWAALSTWVH
jgi:hypothetical protein